MGLLKEFVQTNQAIHHHYAQHDQSAPILKVEGLTVRYESGLALDHLTFELPRATSLAVVGPNGAGKSTMIKAIAGLIPANEGKISVFGAEPGGHICIAYVPQRSLVDWQFPVTVRDVVMMGRTGKLGLLHYPGRKDWDVVHHALDIVNLTDLASRQISELSGGQQQRMFIARALAQEAELMMMDEPLSGLDGGSQEDILNIIDLLCSQGVTILVALHDLKLAAERFHSALLLNHKLIGFGAATEVFSEENLVQAYGGSHASQQMGLMAVDDACCGEDHADD